VIAADTRSIKLQREIEERCDHADRKAPADGGRSARNRPRCASATDLERVGDLSKNIGQARASALDRRVQALKLMRGVEHMSDLVLESAQVEVLDAYAAHDLPTARWKSGRATRKSTRSAHSLFRELLTYMMEDPRKITMCIASDVCAKNVERIGDHATNIAETVFYHDRRRAACRRAAEGRHDELCMTAVTYPKS
jgi:phosphate transport system protein